jgi:serine-type D-Ala-D-Ala carboxypeptidase (penicillin-binding protein 5/6)
MSRALLSVLAVLAVVASLSVPVQASNVETVRSAPLHVDAAAWYLVGSDGAVLAQRDARRRRAPASITKLMTAIVTLEHARPSDVVRVDPRAARVGESTVYLRPNEELTVAELLHGMLIRSGNDAAEALALYVGHGSQGRFVTLMDAEARQLGLTDTTFENPHGLDQAGHLMSARDTTLLVRYALGIPFIRDTLQRSSVSIPGSGDFPTTDDLLESWPPLVAGKTGHTADAGWNEAAAASEDGATVYGSVLGSRNRAERNDALRALLSYGLAQYGPVITIDRGRVYATAKTGYGRQSVELVPRRMRIETVRKDAPLVERVVAPVSVALPVEKGASLGRVEVYEGNDLVAAESLVAAASVTKPGVLGRVGWYARRTAANLWGIVP